MKILFSALLIVLIVVIVVIFNFRVIIQERTIIRLKALIVAQDELVVGKAKEFHGTLLASKGNDGVWRFINKEGVPCRLFRDLEED